MTFNDLIQTTGALSGLICLTLSLLILKKQLKSFIF